MESKRYCSSCEMFKSDGRVISTSNSRVRRFKCSTCLDKASRRKYQSKENTMQEQMNLVAWLRNYADQAETEEDGIYLRKAAAALEELRKLLDAKA